MHIVPNSKGEDVKSKSVSHSVCPYEDSLIVRKHLRGGICFTNTHVSGRRQRALLYLFAISNMCIDNV